jgi:hypothetical protein
MGHRVTDLWTCARCPYFKPGFPGASPGCNMKRCMDEVIGVAPTKPIHFRSVPGERGVGTTQRHQDTQTG